MSRIGKLPIVIPSGVKVNLEDGNLLTVEGPKGKLTRKLSSDMNIAQENGQLTIERPNDLSVLKLCMALPVP